MTERLPGPRGRVVVAIAGWLACAAVACGCDNGTETDNPSIVFHASGCKKPGEEETALTVADAGATERASDKYAGLECLLWDAMPDGRLHVEVYNMSGGCHVSWKEGGSRVRDGQLELAVQDAYAPGGECAVAGCGSCPYDVSFDLADVPDTSGLLVTLRREDCKGKTNSPAEALGTLWLDQQPHGIACIPARSGDLTWWQQCGGNHLPCRGEYCGGPKASECDEGLSCEGGDEGKVCLAPCITDADCALPDVETCQQGFCRVPDHF